MAELTDTELVSQCRAGDKGAYSQLVMRHQERVRRVLRAVLPYSLDVDDVLQEAFLEAYLSLDTLRQPERFRAWVCGIGLNLAKMRQRRQRWLVDWETAVRQNVPIFVANEVMEQAGVAAETEQVTDITLKHDQPSDVQWLSLLREGHTPSDLWVRGRTQSSSQSGEAS